jgi:putative two-component system response regulator
MTGTKKKLLIIDDIELNRAILREAFSKKYEVLEAENGLDGLKILKANANSLVCIFLDILMPVLDGFGVLEQLKNTSVMRTVPIFLITTETGDDIVKKAYDYGVVDFIQKPFDLLIIKRRVQNVIELYSNRNQLEKMFNEQMNTISVQDTELQGNQWAIIETLGQALESRDVESGNHTRRMKQITEAFLKHLTVTHPEYMLTEHKIQQIAQVTPLHDIGKIAIPDRILLKPESAGRLTDEEFEIMKTHTIAGCQLLDSIPNFRGTQMYTYSYNICRYHHERWDGKGYPDHLVGNQIPIEAQVVAMADVYDALISKRVYKPAFTHEKAVEMINNGECGSFNADILQCFNETIDSIYHIIYEKGFKL